MSRWFALLIVLALLSASGIAQDAPPTPPAALSIFRGDPARTGANEEADGLREAPRLAWSFPVRRPVRSTPAIAGDLAYIGDEDGRLYAIDITNGERVWERDTNAPIVSTPAISEGVLYVGGLDQFV
ncbi:MAG: PQQ-binding-like beta-propeller repeat protein [Anaerolineae bacterium]|nr:PQQ-binding-like beta-propeller repeat protein [Anaerolineae bacterium]